ncbi:type III-B CRISPR module-associated protein Cmr3 [Hydrogenobaculum acidophilum]
MLKFTIKPYDVLFFGSGKPFNVGESVQSIFPPHPTTFAGAVCSKIYAGPSKLLKAVYGPFIEKDGITYFPKPQNIFGERKKETIERLFLVEPNNLVLSLFQYSNTNKPDRVEKLAIYKGDEEIESFEGFISIEGLKSWINGEEIKDNCVLSMRDIFDYDQRVGIKIQPSLNSIGGEEDSLYRVKFLQVKKGINFVFWTDFNEEFKDKFQKEPRVLKLGGEMRNVMYEVEEDNFINWITKKLSIPHKIQIKNGDKVKILFLGYGVFDCKVPNINGFKITSMCFSKYDTIGINSGSNVKTKRAFPPGTVFWLKYENKNNKYVEIETISYLIKNQENYDFSSFGNQDFIGTNLVLSTKLNEKEENKYV